ncbi:hypothetical protein [Snuella sedimenti]|uniref:Uncharacterized protein n=1 Tax=Snuella sedimenti TaxID=2798802 RepID=A0A8J7J9Z5_9FLAO|nr:hypothetical protein [Snuella sedimenti]MBJ6367084.1 hypothetical protein [Snuella sedimenti]
MNRKTFIQKALGALLIALPAYAAISCSSSSDDSGNGGGGNGGGGQGNCLQNGTSSSIASNHGHSLTVSKADVNAGVEKTYDITGSSGHSHNVTVSATQFNTLKSNQQISITSTSGDGHTHSVTIRCA